MIVGLLATIAALVQAGGAAAQIELKLNGLHAPEHPVAMTHHFFADRVKQLTDGEITVDVFDARQLGDAVESVQSLRNGTIAFVTVSTSNLSQVDPAVDMFSLPYLFKSADHYWDYLNSERARAS
jgi:TRAP-type C4-dicarboxylate transport system substrate-binding protein